MKKLFLILLIPFQLVLSQDLPLNYTLGNESQQQLKINSANPLSNSITDIITSGDTVWLGTSRGVSLSTDRGLNWTNFYNDETFGTDNVSAIGYNHYNGTFWAATATSVEQNGSTLPKGTGLHFTTDGGATWTSVPQPLDDPGDSLITYGINDGVNLPQVRALPVTVDIQNLTYDIAFTPNAVWITSFAGGIRRSTDNGSTWQRILLPSDSLNSISPNDTIDFALQPVAGAFSPLGNLNHRLFSVISVFDSILYVGTANGINKTTNADAEFPSWEKFNHQNQENPISGNFVVALGYNDFNNTVWGATWRAEDNNEFYGISSSSDGGMNWQTYLDDERVHNFGFKNAQVIAPSDNGAFRTSNGGSTWILPNSIVDSETGVSLQTDDFFAASVEGNDVWLGSNDGLAKLEETTFWNGNWKIYFASQPLQAEDDTYCFPNPFSPRQEQLKIRYSTNGIDESVTILILDYGMNPVRTVIQNATRNRTIEGAPDYWDGRDEAGNYVPNGVYLYRVEVGDKDPVYGKILVLQ